MEINFIGATTEVTGSMTWIKEEQGDILIDCGIYQGGEKVVVKNTNKLPFVPKDIKAIILTHGHLDHSGFIPRLIKLGFRGDIFCTRPTMKLARLVMSDSAKILKNENNPLHSFYSSEDVAIATSLFKTKNFHEPFEILGIEVEFIPAGHILGAASVVIKGNRTIVFSGDVGRFNDPLIFPPELCPAADVVIMESTYGGKSRKGNLEEELHQFLKKIKADSKVGIIASFAIARAQLLVTLIHNFYKEHPEEKVRFVIDGPMMTQANNVYNEFANQTKMPLALKEALSEVEVIDEAREWLSLQKKSGPLLIVTSSGMVSGGRIWRYLENWQDDENACLFLPGYQGEGTAGRLLSEGKRLIQDQEGVEVHWRGEVLTSEAFSSHADQNELLSWLSNVDKKAHIFLNHGEMSSKTALRDRLLELGYEKVDLADQTIKYRT